MPPNAIKLWADTDGVGFADLQDFLVALERDGDLARIRVPVDPHLEVTGIVQRASREQGPALVFENPTRGRMPLAINVFGTRSEEHTSELQSRRDLVCRLLLEKKKKIKKLILYVKKKKEKKLKN